MMCGLKARTYPKAEFFRVRLWPGPGNGQIQILLGHLLGQEDDLAGVLLHVAYDLIDGLEDGDIPALRLGSLDETLVRQMGENGIRLRDGVPEELEELRGGEIAAGRKFLVSYAYVGVAADSVHDPLTHVAA
jgi:hypothetical protein